MNWRSLNIIRSLKPPNFALILEKLEITPIIKALIPCQMALGLIPKASLKKEGIQPHINITIAKQPAQCGTNAYSII